MKKELIFFAQRYHSNFYDWEMLSIGYMFTNVVEEECF